MNVPTLTQEYKECSSVCTNQKDAFETPTVEKCLPDKDSFVFLFTPLTLDRLFIHDTENLN